MHSIVPCADCAPKRQQLEDLRFVVHGCDPLADRPGFCRIEFSEAAATRGAAEADTPPGARGTAVAAAPAVLTPTQVATVQAIVNVFETGEVLGDYGSVTVIAGDTGHLTFGRSQTTLGSGNLAKLLQQYCDNAGALFGARLAPLLPRFAAGDLTLDDDQRLHNLLRATADDRVMRETQDRFFDETCFQPAHKASARLGIASPLGVAVVYDSHVHGSWGTLRERATAAVGSPAQAGERAWIAAYVRQRRDWLATHPRSDLRATVYRMDALQRLIDLDMWALPLPLVVRGREISTLSLAAVPPGCYDGPAPGSRPIALATPLLRGLDVRRVQLALSDRGIDIRADGVYGQGSQRCVQAFQRAHGLPATGAMEPAEILTLLA